VLEKVLALRNFPDFGSSKGVVKLSYLQMTEGINGSHPTPRSMVKKGGLVLGVEHTFSQSPKSHNLAMCPYPFDARCLAIDYCH
jgi:hypothetical protein